MRAATFARKFSLLAFAFAWGAVLVYAGLYMTASGHGTYVPFALATSPVSLIPLLIGSRHVFWTIMFAVPFWWVMMFAMASAAHRLWQRLFVILITLHYIGAILLMYRTDFAFGMRFRAYRGMMHFAPLWLIGTELLWFAGQAIMWHEYTRPRAVVVAVEAPGPAPYMAIGPAGPAVNGAVPLAPQRPDEVVTPIEPLPGAPEPGETAPPPQAPPEPEKS